MEQKIEIKSVNPQKDTISKSNKILVAVLSAAISIAEPAVASTEAFIDKDHVTEVEKTPIKEKSSVEMPTTLSPLMTHEQIEAVAKQAIQEYEAQKSFDHSMEEVLSSCAKLTLPDNFGPEIAQEQLDSLLRDQSIVQAAQPCVDWYKNEVSIGNQSGALKILRNEIQKISPRLSTKIVLGTGSVEDMVKIMAIWAVASLALGVGVSWILYGDDFKK